MPVVAAAVTDDELRRWTRTPTSNRSHCVNSDAKATGSSTAPVPRTATLSFDLALLAPSGSRFLAALLWLTTPPAVQQPAGGRRRVRAGRRPGRWMLQRGGLLGRWSLGRRGRRHLGLNGATTTEVVVVVVMFIIHRPARRPGFGERTGTGSSGRGRRRDVD